MVLLRCPRCAKEIPDDSHFCRRCGCALAAREGWSGPAPVRIVPALPADFGGGRQPKADRRREDFKVARTKSRPGVGLLALIGIGAGVGAFNTSLRVKSPAPLQSPPVTIRDSRVGRTGYVPPPSFPAPIRSDPASNAYWPPTPYVPGPPPVIQSLPGHPPLPAHIVPQVQQAWPRGANAVKPNDGRR